MWDLRVSDLGPLECMTEEIPLRDPLTRNNRIRPPLRFPCGPEGREVQGQGSTEGEKRGVDSKRLVDG